MAGFADLISKLPLYQELDKAAGRDSIGAAQHGRNEVWRRWLRKLVGATARLGLNKKIFAEVSGQKLEDACGLAVRIDDKITYLSRARIRELIPDPVYLSYAWKKGHLLWEDPVTSLLCNVDDLRWDERVEVDLSSLPIVRAKKGARTGRSK